MFELTEYIGVVAFAVSGFYVAVRANLDLLGILIAVFLTAFGGGIIRDVLVDRTPYVFSHDIPGLMVVAVTLFLILIGFHRRDTIENSPIFIISDSIGLASFSIAGAMVGLEYHFNFTGVLATAFLTAVGGGITRDVIINEVPFVFRTDFYGTIALLIGFLIYLCDFFGILNHYAVIFLFLFGVGVRWVAYSKKWSIPLK